MVLLSLKTKRRGRFGRHVPRREMHIPSEILIMITDHLTRKQWKPLRLVSRDFHECLSHVPLFPELWFSPHTEDLVVFHGVCDNPSLARHVTKILYDTTWFPDLSVQDLRNEWPNNERDYPHPRTSSTPSRRLVFPWQRRRDEGKWLREHPGPQEFFDRLQHQKSVDQVRNLAHGISKLPNLTGFYVETSRFENPDKLYSSFTRRTYTQTSHSSLTDSVSPFRRKWRNHPSYPEPYGRYSYLHAPGVIGADEIDFEEIMVAIQRSGARIKVLDVSPDAIYLLYKPVSLASKSVFANLTSLNLNLHTWPYWIPKFSSRLFEMLNCAKGLESLYLGFRCRPDEIPLYMHRQSVRDDLAMLLHKDLVLPSLHTLVLHQLRTRSDTLFRILRSHAFTLRCLNLISVDFFGRKKDPWEKVMEFLKSELNLGLVHVYPLYENEHDGFPCTGWWSLVTPEKGDMPRSLDRYIKGGNDKDAWTSRNQAICNRLLDYEWFDSSP